MSLIDYLEDVAGPHQAARLGAQAMVKVPERLLPSALRPLMHTLWAVGVFPEFQQRILESSEATLDIASAGRPLMPQHDYRHQELVTRSEWLSDEVRWLDANIRDHLHSNDSGFLWLPRAFLRANQTEQGALHRQTEHVLESMLWVAQGYGKLISDVAQTGITALAAAQDDAWAVADSVADCDYTFGFTVAVRAVDPIRRKLMAMYRLRHLPR